MTKILLTRHGHVEGINPERFRGRQQLELTARGRKEAAAVAARIAEAWRPAKIYTSPMARCIDTGAAIAQATGASRRGLRRSQRHRLWGLAVQNLRRGEGRRCGAVCGLVCDAALIRFPDGESLQDLAARAANVLRFVLARHPDDTIVLVGHDSVNRAVVLQCLDCRCRPTGASRRSRAASTKSTLAAATFRIVRINETRHLDVLAPAQ